jgi:hypothetical protein
MSPAFAVEKETIVIDGDDWLRSSVAERRAFIRGAGNIIVAELAYARKRNLPAPPVGDRAAKAVANLTVDDIEARITRWYQANPTKASTPVMAVVWREFVRPHRQASKE